MGMADTDGFPLRKKLFRPSMFVGDVIAGHGVIAFINAASAVGCKTATGDHMVEAVQETMLDFRLSN
jgi:shikimate dehydrogenase